jgi:hypothetical protein
VQAAPVLRTGAALFVLVRTAANLLTLSFDNVQEPTDGRCNLWRTNHSPVGSNQGLKNYGLSVGYMFLMVVGQIESKIFTYVTVQANASAVIA